jgi:aldehyde:ferredoxin oxidoreductase
VERVSVTEGREWIAMPYGYAGKLLFVDLSAGSLEEETPDEATYRKWIGGTGLGVKVLMERTKPGFDPLGPENVLAFTSGPLTATGVYGGGRYTVATKSPLTGAWADSSSGGFWGPELKKAGYDGVFFAGTSTRPVCLVIDAGKAQLIDAGDLWGKDSYDTDDLLQERLGDPGSWRIACIGPAGERCSRLAGIVNEKGRLAARSGVGAVMGSKKLKAVAVRGSKSVRIKVADPAGLKAVQKDYGEALKNSPFHQGLTAVGTGGGTSFLLSIGDCPADNWSTTGTDALPDCGNLDSAKMDAYKLESYGCSTCPVRCGALVQVKEGPFATAELHRPEYETLAALGPMCRNANVEAVMRANELCNRYGLDTMGVGGAVAFAMECYDKYLIDKKDTDGLELGWGKADALVALVEAMGKGEGFGALLADGAKFAAERIGKGSEQYAMHVAGRAVPYHDPRMAPSSGTFYIADAQPAQHMGPQGMAVLEQGAPLGTDGLLQPGDSGELFADYHKKGEIYVRGAAYFQLLSSSGLCGLYGQFYTPPVVELMRPVTGWDMDWREGLEIGRRILTLRQAFNAREGIRPEDFRLPKRFEAPLGVGPAAGQSAPFETLRTRYFEAMGWDPKSGRPAANTLAELGIDEALVA